MLPNNMHGVGLYGYRYKKHEKSSLLCAGNTTKNTTFCYWWPRLYKAVNFFVVFVRNLSLVVVGTPTSRVPQVRERFKYTHGKHGVNLWYFDEF